MITFEIPFTLAAKQADRSRIATGRGGKQFVHHYQPSKVTNNAKSLAALCAPHRPAVPLDGPLSMELYVVFPWLQKHSPRHRKSGLLPKDTKPDWDNLGKQISDVLAACGFYTNDSRLSDVRIRKRFGDTPYVQVTIDQDHGNQ